MIGSEMEVVVIDGQGGGIGRSVIEDVYKRQVQGVGFRFTTYQKAKNLGLTGWVCNLSDGSVEACIQGEEKLIDYLINELQHDRFIRIDSIKMEEIAVLKHETSFGMKN